MFSSNHKITTGIVLMGDPRIAAMTVCDNGEKLFDLLSEHRLRFDTSREFVNKLSLTISQLREGVISRLLTAQSLLPDGVTFLIREGHRPISVQQFLFDQYLADVRCHNPKLSGPKLIQETSKFVAPPNVAPHSTGGAVDLTLISVSSGCELEMGSAFNGDPIKTNGANFTGAQNISDEAKKNRELLSSAMLAAGFVNYPTEWWHWSFGDKYWAFISGSTHAIYGGVEAG